MEISGKDITVQIELNDDNILLNSTVYQATDAYQSVTNTSSKFETTISGFGASGSGDNNVIEVLDFGNTSGSVKSCTNKIKMITYNFNSEEKVGIKQFCSSESVRKNLAMISF
ncbi:hypothetical protein POM88_035498 [Heracleum sosnowskyi]|uniref:Uncharacterized protein n=1 Tax=Heracleum sosnowskyi TaxID=360622 RepID=A0AAD8MDB9_9APIA|nr:hypothetical protein POM88_035498 [Heracleum sosnowskyi]